MVKELDRTEQLCEVTMDDLGQVQIINTATQDQLRNEEDRCVTAEEQLRVGDYCVDCQWCLDLFKM